MQVHGLNMSNSDTDRTERQNNIRAYVEHSFLNICDCTIHGVTVSGTAEEKYLVFFFHDGKT